MKWITEEITNEDGKWIVEKFPKGHSAEGKERARYLTEPSQEYLVKLASEPKPKTPEEIQAEKKARFAECKNDAERIQMMAEDLGLK